jgi:hypothetical protein
VVGMVNDEMRKYEAEVERRGMPGPAEPLRGAYPGTPGIVGSTLTPAAPLEQQIREVSEEVISWAEQLAERRRFAADAARGLKEAEENFSERSIRLAQIMADYRAAGQGLNAVKQPR